jgi:hypothetical protein
MEAKRVVLGVLVAPVHSEWAGRVEQPGLVRPDLPGRVNVLVAAVHFQPALLVVMVLAE